MRERFSKDVVSLFVGMEESGNAAIYGYTARGDIVEVFDPEVEYVNGTSYSPSLATDGHNFVTIDGDAYVTVTYTLYDSYGLAGWQHRLYCIDTDGTVNLVNTFGGYPNFFSPSPGEFGAVNIDDRYVYGAQFKLWEEAYAVSPDGTRETLSDLNRLKTTVNSDFVALEDAIYYIADQRNPQGHSDHELWRRNADGSNEYLWAGVGNALDIEEFNGQVWLSVYQLPIQGGEQEIWRFDNDGLAQMITLPDGIRQALHLETNGKRLLAYAPVGSTGIYEIDADGSVTSLGASGFGDAVSDVEFYRGDIYFKNTSPSGYLQLYRLEDDGSATTITTTGLDSLGSAALRSAAGRLWFEGVGEIEDPFGGTKLVYNALFSLGANGEIVQHTSDGSDHADIRLVGDVFGWSSKLASNVRGTANADNLSGTGDAETLLGFGGSDTILARNGHDEAYGGNGNDLIHGGAGEDYVDGGKGGDKLFGDDDKDWLNGRSGNDTLRGGNGNDELNGHGGRDELNGNKGKDELNGGPGNDRLNGSGGRDLLSGDSGNDTLRGGKGIDKLYGGTGSDQFVLRAVDTGGLDYIVDFEDDIDSLRLDEAIWGGGMTKSEVLATYGSDNGFGQFNLNFDGIGFSIEGDYGLEGKPLLNDIHFI